MKFVLSALALLFLSSACCAQQVTDDPNYLKGAIAALQAQRNNALDSQAVAEAKLNQANQQIKELQLKIKGFEDKPKAEDKSK